MDKLPQSLDSGGVLIYDDFSKRKLMMRKSKVTADEIQAAEKAQDDRKQRRALGFSKMRERDQGWVLLYDLNSKKTVAMEWHVPFERREEWIPYSGIPENTFSLKIDDKLLVFDTEEFRRALRWA